MKIRIVILLSILLFPITACDSGVNPLDKIKEIKEKYLKSNNSIRFVELDLKDEVTIQGRLVLETDEYYLIEWKGKEVRFTKSKVIAFRDMTDADNDQNMQADIPLVEDVPDHTDVQTELSESTDEQEIAPQIVHLHLKTGDVISGVLERETEDEYLINYQGGTIGFSVDEVKKIVRSNGKKDENKPKVISEENSEEDKEDGPSGEAIICLKYGGTISGTILKKLGNKYTVEWNGDTIELLECDIEKIDLKQKKKPNADFQAGRHRVTIYLPNGKTFSGNLIKENATIYYLIWEGQKVEFKKDNVEKIEDHGEIFPDNMVVVYLVNGGAISGTLIDETDEMVTIEWQGVATDFKRDEIDHIDRAKVLNTEDGTITPEAQEEWSYTHDIVVKLLNGEIFDVNITGITTEAIIFRKTFEEGGYMEQEIPLSKLDHFMFKPVDNERSLNIENSLRELFPNMRFYKDGNITIVTDSFITMVKQYKRILRQTQTEIYCKFFQAFKNHTQEVQNYVVVFDSADKWIEYTLSDGVPGWIVPGYFHPTNKILYLYNWIGEEMEKFITDMMEQIYGKQIDNAAESIKQQIDERYHLSIDGQAKSIKNKFWAYFDWRMNMLRRITFSVLRHEFAHETFSNWGLQMVVVSKFQKDSVSNLEEKKKFLETNDINEKKRILLELMTQQSEEELPQIESANSWFTEGVATYCETDPLGDQNDERIYGFQKLMSDNSFLPLEQLSVYKIGSFPGVYHEVMLYAYSQSWALVKYLMDNYREGFITYMNRVAETPPEGNQDIEWLEEAIGKDRRTLEKELIDYMSQFPPVDDPVTKIMERNKEFHDDLVTFGATKV